MRELWTAFIKNKSKEDELKQKAAAVEELAKAQEEAKGPQKGKKKGKEAVTTLQFGVGTRKFFDYLLVLNLAD